ncbi:MAG: 30S ribosomal protein S20 [Verrucomicrobia bacterium]|nr:30S ribosomal protein S20 [Verrucomicrobiota bacterium]
MAEDKKATKARRPQALKRDDQSAARNLRNRSFKAKVTTAVRSLKGTVAEKDAAKTKSQLNVVFSLMDKGVKKGIFKLNKASRVKARLSAFSKQA